MAQFEYDTSGKTSYYFIISILALYLIPSTISKLTGGGSSKKKKPITPSSDVCFCGPCIHKTGLLKQLEPKAGITLSSIIYVASWILLVFLLYRVSTFEGEALYDPFEVLGISQSASSREIKKRYRDLSLQYHPDKNPDDPNAEALFIRIAKAYQSLTDEDTKKNWEEYGNPDGPQAASFGIALPAWIVDKDNSAMVLAIYVLMFIVIFPVIVGIWWSRSQKYVKDKVLVDTVRFFFHKGEFQKSTAVKDVVERISVAHEFADIKVNPTDQQELASLQKVVDGLPKLKKVRGTKGNLKARMILHAHLERYPLESTNLRENWAFIVDKSDLLIQTAIDVVTQKQQMDMLHSPNERGYRRTLMAIMHLSQMLVQALPRENDDPLLQIPHFLLNDGKRRDVLRYFHDKKRPIRSVQDLFLLDDDDIRERLRSLHDEELEDIFSFGRQFPYLKVTAEFKVQGEGDRVTGGAVVTLVVYLRRMGLEEMRITDAEERAAAREASAIAAANQEKLAKRGKGKGRRKKKNIDDSSEGIRNLPVDAANTEDQASDEKKDEEGNERSNGSEHSNDDDEKDEDSSYDSEDGLISDDDLDDEFTKKRNPLQDVDWESPAVHCPFYPKEKQETWWVFVCEQNTDKVIIGPRRCNNLKDERTIEMQHRVPKESNVWPLVMKWQLCVVSDSYLCHETQIPLTLTVHEPEEVISEPEEESESDGEEVAEGFSSDDDETDDDDDDF